MKVKYHPKDWRPKKDLNDEILCLFTMLHVVEPIENLTLHVVATDHIMLDIGNFKANPTKAWACYAQDTNEVFLPAKRPKGFVINKEDYNAFVLWNLLHEYVHAIRQRDGRDTGHRGFSQEMNGLEKRLREET